jgi:hypothetical protein
MKRILVVLAFVTLIGAGCAVEPAGYYDGGGAAVTVYGEYPHAYYGHYYGGPHYYHGRRYYHPYDRDHYFYRY